MVGGGRGSFIGPVHRAAIRMDDLADLVAGCFSRDTAANAQTGAELGIESSRLYPDWQRLIAAEKGRIDFLAICTPNDSHYPIAKAALEAGINVMCEKPLDKRNAWKMDPRRSGPSCVVADIGVHGAHLIEYVTGLEIQSLAADLSSFAPGNRLDDDASILMRLSKGAKAVMVTSKIATGEENGIRLRVYGDKASLVWKVEEGNYLHVKEAFGPERIYKRNAPYISGLSAVSKRCSRIPAGHHEGFIEAFANHYREFCAALRGAKSCDFPQARDGRRTIQFVDAALESSRSNAKWVRV